jgi:cellulose synthase/poly-beta-1,6-N-acetylglucosamine synthase-like glycosyltransferase
MAVAQSLFRQPRTGGRPSKHAIIDLLRNTLENGPPSVYFSLLNIIASSLNGDLAMPEFHRRYIAAQSTLGNLSGEKIPSLKNESQLPHVSVVIPTLNRDEPLCNTLRYFFEKETYPSFEIIVIDQSERHSDTTTAFLAQNSALFQHVCVNYMALPKARNQGVALSTGEIVVFVDDDVEPADDFLSAHVRSYSDPSIVGVAGAAPLPGEALKSRGMIGEEAYRATTVNALRPQFSIHRSMGSRVQHVLSARDHS